MLSLEGRKPVSNLYASEVNGFFQALCVPNFFRWKGQKLREKLDVAQKKRNASIIIASDFDWCWYFSKIDVFVQFFNIFPLRILLVDGIRFKNCIVSTSRIWCLRLPSLFFIYFANWYLRSENQKWLMFIWCSEFEVWWKECLSTQGSDGRLY